MCSSSLLKGCKSDNLRVRARIDISDVVGGGSGEAEKGVKTAIGAFWMQTVERVLEYNERGGHGCSSGAVEHAVHASSKAYCSFKLGRFAAAIGNDFSLVRIDFIIGGFELSAVREVFEDGQRGVVDQVLLARHIAVILGL